MKSVAYWIDRNKHTLNENHATSRVMCQVSSEIWSRMRDNIRIPVNLRVEDVGYRIWFLSLDHLRAALRMS
jgi:hypothetical protein